MLHAVLIILFFLLNNSAVLSQENNMKYNKLTAEEENVIINKGTEQPFSGMYCLHKAKGTYVCKRCNAPLYRSENKFDSQCGWPSFDDEIMGAVKRVPDADGRRTEIICNNCGAHLGHVFIGEKFTDKNIRHCVNSISLNFIPGEKEAKTEKAYFAGGCFWGVEYFFRQEKGNIMNYLIIGNGVAGDEASIMIRKNDATADITLISESTNYFYYKPKLINYLANDISLNKFTIHDKAFYEKLNIKNIPGTKITKINPDKNIVIAEDKTEYEYDKLLLATGSSAFIPPIKGVNKNGIFTIREVEDCDNILEYIKDKNNIIVVGGGLLGLETANSLRSLAKKVTVIEYFSTLLPRQLDNDGANLLKKILEEKGLNFILAGVVETIEGKDKVEKVILKSGREIKADAVIISAGIRGRIELAKDIGIEINKGIVVNDFMHTSAENIYCAGDSVEHNGKLYGIWNASKEQGKIAGLNMVGIKTQYNGTLFSNILKVTGIDLYSAGNFNSKNGKILISKNENEYLKFIIKNNQLIGAIVLGNANAVKIASKVFEGKAAGEELKKYVQ